LDDEAVVDKSAVKRVVMVSGKFYYELIKERQVQSAEIQDQVAFVRIEELAPFPFAQLQSVLEAYPNVEEYTWVQEEPRNQGAWGHVQPRIQEVLKAVSGGSRVGVDYRGRKESAVPATGVGKIYQVQQRAVLDSVFEGL
jgi:probable 2-oxoglutarate dehydrogenase E1 component DHKTD1